MATQFSRLYRELCQTSPHDKARDVYFTRERKVLLADLGHKVQIKKDTPVQLCKHHGKAARRRSHEARLKAISVEDIEKAKKEREVRELSMRTNQVHELTSKIQSLIQNDKYVSKNLWAKYDKIYGEAQASSQPDTTNRSTSKTSNKCTEGKGSQKRSKLCVRMDYSKNKWSKAERERLNIIYWELKRPATKSLALWDNYFLEFAHNFQVFFSGRSIDAIVRKVKHMYATRQFEEPGEKKFWKSVSGSNFSQKSVGSDPSTQMSNRHGNESNYSD